MTKYDGHDPRETIRGLQQLLCSPFKRVGFFTGTGTSMAIKSPGTTQPIIPGILNMTNEIYNSLTKRFKAAFDSIRDELEAQDIQVNIETVLSVIRLKAQVVGKEKLCGLDQKGFEELEKKIETEILRLVSPVIPEKIIHEQFVSWIHNGKRFFPVEIFTTNYDYFYEIACERNLIPYFDGFVGSYEPFFLPSSVEENDELPKDWIRLWKVHGSLGWSYNKDKGRIYREKGQDHLIIYPSLLKYNDSRKQPYQSFIDRLSAFIRKGESFLLTMGYSFGDQHLNETIFHALTRTKSSAVYSLYFGDLDEHHFLTQLAKREPRLSVLGNNAAIIGGRFAPWRLSREPSLSESIEISHFFDEDAVPPEEEWLGTGKLIIVDFERFVDFLDLVIGYPEKEATNGSE